MSYRVINPASEREMPFRMLLEPAGGGTYLKACEADSWRGLVAAILDDPAYELADVRTRLVDRLRLANDIVLLAEVDGRRIRVADRPGQDAIDVHSDEPFLRSLHQLGVISLDPRLTSEGSS